MIHCYSKVLYLPALMVTVMIMPGPLSVGAAACCHGRAAIQAVEHWVDHHEEQASDRGACFVRS